MGTSRAGITDTPETVRRACDRCHERKVKCDGQHPCARCVRKKEICAFDKPVLPKGPTPRRDRRDESARYHPYRASTADQNATPTILEKLEDLEHIGLSQPLEVDQVETWDETMLDPFADWTAFLASRPSSRPGSRPSSRPTSRPPSRSGSRQVSPMTKSESQWMIVRSRPPTPPSLALSDYVQQGLISTLEPTPLGLSVPLFNVPFTPPEDISPILTLTLETLVKPQLDVFFVRIFPMMPVFPPSYTFSKLSDPNAIRCPDFVAMILSMCALSLIHPLMSHEMVEKVARAKKAKVLLDEACRLMARWDHGSNVTLEAVMAKYLMFGTLFELGHTGPARLRLKEAVHLGAEMCLDRVESYQGLEPLERKRRLRMYWVLAVTERAYALQRSGGVVFSGNIKRITHIDLDPPSISLHYLTQIFSYLDQDIITCWNNQCPRASGQTCHHLTSDRVTLILSALNGSAPDVFGEGSETDFKQLTDSQRADLFITWQWVKNRIWRLAAIHGLTTEDGAPELGVGYVVSAAMTTVAICRRLPLSAMESHGTGFLEKLYDIGSILTNLLSSPSMALQATLVSTIQSTSWSDTLESLYSFLSLHRGGTNDFASQLAQAIKIAGSVRLLTGVS